MDDAKELAWDIYSFVLIRGDIAEVAARAIDATIPYVMNVEDAKALEIVSASLREKVLIADDELWDAITEGRTIMTD